MTSAGDVRHSAGTTPVGSVELADETSGEPASPCDSLVDPAGDRRAA